LLSNKLDKFRKISISDFGNCREADAANLSLDFKAKTQNR